MGDYRRLTPRAIRLLVNVAMGDPWENTRVEAVESLDKILANTDTQTRMAVAAVGDPSVCECLAKIAVQGASSVRWAALRGLVRMWDGNDPATGKPVADIFSPDQARALVQHYEEGADALRTILLKLDRKTIHQAACAALREGRHQVVGLITELDPSQAFEILLPLGTAENPKLRAAVVQWLGKIDDPCAEGVLAEGLRDADESVRRIATNVLKGLARTPRDPTLRAIQAIEKQDWDQVVSLGSTSVEPLNTALAECGTLGEAVGILQTMGRLQDPRCVVPIVPFLDELYASANALHDMMERSLRSKLSLLDLKTIPQEHKLSSRCRWEYFGILAALTKGHAVGQVDYGASRIPSPALVPLLQNLVCLLTIIHETLTQIETGAPSAEDGSRDPLLTEKLAITHAKEQVAKTITSLSAAEKDTVA